MSFSKHIRNPGDALRPSVGHDGIKHFIVFGRKQMFGHQGKPIELFRSQNRSEAYDKLKELGREEDRLIDLGLIPVHTVYGSFGVKNQFWRYVVILLTPDGPTIQGGSRAEDEARQIMHVAAGKNMGKTAKLILCQTGRELDSQTISTSNPTNG